MPKVVMMRQAKILAKFRGLTVKELYAWEALGLIRPRRKTPTSKRWYVVAEIEELIRQNFR